MLILYLTKWLNVNKKTIIINHMVNNDQNNLNEIFSALSDPTRREMIQMVAEKERTVSELAEPFDMSLAGISKHIKVLERAHLIDRNIKGRVHILRLNAYSLSQVNEWLRFYEIFWDNRFDLLESELLKAKKKEH
ncbi:ArsR/SmtB family transcription factor [Aureibacillus halotolerans]|uniref:ArsR family transcriptional regulator n=1 Tax=Aureibacillus halotolerans TaxID=1508390 RepID=A0A4R6U4G4_9BACI|nr:metalloregulator ArsR/SmtB family transcription factor [Aureibacillus halotolerans]TDQ41031.1 ArsR family transcriptional regulator [Aureibacillus halotolerans]